MAWKWTDTVQQDVQRSGGAGSVMPAAALLHRLRHCGPIAPDPLHMDVTTEPDTLLTLALEACNSVLQLVTASFIWPARIPHCRGNAPPKNSPMLSWVVGTMARDHWLLKGYSPTFFAIN